MKFTNRIILYISLIAIQPTVIEAKSVDIYTVGITGQKFLELNETSKSVYVVAAIDGIMVSPFVGASSKKLTILKQCLTGMSLTQIGAMVTKYLRNNPDEWHLPANLALMNTLRKSCPKFNQSIK